MSSSTSASGGSSSDLGGVSSEQLGSVRSRRGSESEGKLKSIFSDFHNATRPGLATNPYIYFGYSRADLSGIISEKHFYLLGGFVS